MRAALIKAFGEPTEVLELADVPEPSAPAEGEVLVGVEYLGNCHRPPPARALIEGVGFAADSPLEGGGFELPVPRADGTQDRPPWRQHRFESGRGRQ